MTNLIATGNINPVCEPVNADCGWLKQTRIKIVFPIITRDWNKRHLSTGVTDQQHLTANVNSNSYK